MDNPYAAGFQTGKDIASGYGLIDANASVGAVAGGGGGTPTPGNDIITGTTGADTIYALAGDDTVYGKDGEKRRSACSAFLSNTMHGWKRYTANRGLCHVGWLSRYACCMVPAQESGWDPTRSIPPGGRKGSE